MEIYKPQFDGTEASPILYKHPFLVSRDRADSIVIWSFAGAPTQPPTVVAVLEGKVTRPSCHFLGSRYLVSFDQVDLANSVVLVHSLSDGTLLDRKPLDVIQPRLYDTDSRPPPAQGECTPLLVADGRIAVWKNGSHALNGSIEVYRLSDAGKLTLASQFFTPDDAPALAVHSLGYEYFLPDPIHLTPEYLIGSLVLFPTTTLHLIRWSSPELRSVSPPPTHVELPFTRSLVDDITMTVTLRDHLFIPESNQLVFAHYESPFDFMDLAPITAIRSINPDVLSVNWCTSINQKVDQLYHNPTLDVLVAVGWMFEPNRLTISILDARTGQVRREDNIGDRPLYKCGALRGVAGGIYCGMTPSVDEIVIVFGDGQYALSALPDFIVHGFAKRDVTVEGQEGTATALVTTPFPETSLLIPRNAKQRRAKAHGSWHWVDRAFIAEGQLIIKPEDGSSKFVVLRWK